MRHTAAWRRVDIMPGGGVFTSHPVAEPCQDGGSLPGAAAAAPAMDQDLLFCGSFCASISDLQLAENFFMSSPAFTHSRIS